MEGLVVSLVTFIAGEGTKTAETVTPDEMEHYLETYRQHVVVSRKTSRQLYPSICEEGANLNSSLDIAGAIDIGFHAFVLSRGIAASANDGPT